MPTRTSPAGNKLLPQDVLSLALSRIRTKVPRAASYRSHHPKGSLSSQPGSKGWTGSSVLSQTRPVLMLTRHKAELTQNSHGPPTVPQTPSQMSALGILLLMPTIWESRLLFIHRTELSFFFEFYLARAHTPERTTDRERKKGTPLWEGVVMPQSLLPTSPTWGCGAGTCTHTHTHLARFSSHEGRG